MIVPIVGTLAAAAVPVARHVMKGRHEATALAVAEEVRAAQERFRRENGAYASDLASLVAGCAGRPAALDEARVAALESAGYRLTVAPAAPAPEGRTDCHGRPLAPDYFVAAEPVSAAEPAQQAFGARATGDVLVFYDGLAPRPADFRDGLATPAADRNTFKIP